MALLATWRSLNSQQRETFRSSNQITSTIAEGFTLVEAAHEGIRSDTLHQLRERLRDLMSAMNPQEFPRFGTNLVSIDAIIQAVGLDRRLSFQQDFNCNL